MFTEEMIREGVDTGLLVEGLDELIELAKKDYREWSDLGSWESSRGYSDKIKEEFIANYNRGISYSAGRKYIRIFNDYFDGLWGRHRNSVWGFVVAVHNDKKFRFGDILKAEGWKTPARNYARGNVIDKTFDNVRWTGAI